MPIRIQNGTNHVELAAPTLTGNVDLTLPNGVGTANQVLRNSGTAGELEFATLAVGQNNVIVNTAQVTIDSTSTFNSGSQAFVRFAAMDAAYTTTVAGSIIATFSWSFTNSQASADMSWRLFRKIGSGTATEILVNANPVGSSSSAMIPNYRENVNNQGSRICYSFIDTPGHTAGDVITYEHHVLCEGSNTINLNHGAQTAARHGTSVSTITFMEVAP